MLFLIWPFSQIGSFGPMSMSRSTDISYQMTSYQRLRFKLEMRPSTFCPIFEGRIYDCNRFLAWNNREQHCVGERSI
jgi:hypothetical protein